MVEEAVQLARDAVAGTAADDPAHASRLEGLGGALNRMFEQTGNSQALAESVAARRAAVEATPDDGAGRFARRHNLALSLQNLAERTDDPLALVDARDSLEAVVAALPDDHPDRAIGLHNLSLVDAAWYRRFGNVADLRRAVDGVRSAIAATPADHPSLGSRLETLSRLLVTLSDETGDVAVLAEALRTAREALAATARDVPVYAVQLVTLGLALWRQHGQTGRPALIAEAWQCFYDAARHPVASANLRIGAYQRAAQVAAAAGRTPQQALACIEAAVALLPLVTPADLARTDQEYRIGRMPHLAVHAATAAVAAGRPDRAVELLEQTRGVLAAAQLDYLTRHDHSRPLGIRDLAACAADGPIVYLYASVTWCDALILTPNPDPSAAVQVVPLADSEDEVLKQVGRLLELVGAEYGDADPEQLYERATQAQIVSVLDWLRDAIVTPVLRALGHTSPPRDRAAWPRVWWCPVGIFSYLPVHAVCLDEVVSSYVSTARALRYARIQPEPGEPAAGRPLVVAVPDARGVPPLPGAAIEAAEVVRIFPGARRMPLPTRDRVLESLPDHPIAHFACHGVSDRGDPGSASALILYDYAERALTVPDISALRLPGGLAYLSVCETALTTLELANESVHIAGAFQLAGYQHVIGTLWSVLDRPAARVARDFYLRLTQGDTARPDLRQTGQALHDATVALRGVFRDSPAVWAAYTHTGP
jgi:tetratricopeptide (TPR) repeat protein